jgi:hypothetical protein
LRDPSVGLKTAILDPFQYHLIRWLVGTTLHFEGSISTMWPVFLPVDTGHRADIDRFLLDRAFELSARIVHFCLTVIRKAKDFGHIVHAKTTTDTGILINHRYFHSVFLSLPQR